MWASILAIVATVLGWIAGMFKSTPKDPVIEEAHDATATEMDVDRMSDAAVDDGLRQFERRPNGSGQAV